jgi:hypothetical protein
VEFLLKYLTPILVPIITPIFTLWASAYHSKINVKEEIDLIDKLSEKLTLKDKYAVTELFRLRYKKIYDYADIVKIMRHEKSSKLLYIVENSDIDVIRYIIGGDKLKCGYYNVMYKFTLFAVLVTAALLFPVGVFILYFLFSVDAGLNFENVISLSAGILAFLVGGYGFRVFKVSINCSKYINELRKK